MMDGSVVKTDEISNVDGEKKYNVKKELSFRGKWKSPEYRRKFLHSVCICGCFVSMGINAGQTGPTLLDLQIITNTDLEKVSGIFTSKSIGNLFGAAVCGIVYSKINADLLLFLSVLIAGASAIITPFCSYYELMIAVQFVAGCSSGLIDTAGNALLIRLWGTQGRGFMQFLHFCFAIGGVLSPLFSEPFLAPKPNQQKSTIDITMIENTSLSINSTTFPPMLPKETYVKYAFLISGLVSILTALPFVPFFFLESSKQQKIRNKEIGNQRKLPRLNLFITLIMICFFNMVYCCVEDTFANFLMVFLVTQYDTVSKSKGAFATAIYWASFASSRFVMVFLCRIFSSLKLLIFCLCLMIVSFTGFFVSAHFGIVNVLIAFGALAGLSMSAIFPAAFSWTEAQIIRVTSVVAGSIHVSAGITGMVNPLVLSFMMEEVSNMWFCYLLLGETILVSIIFVIIHIYSQYYLTPKFGPCNESVREDIQIQDEFLDKGFGERDVMSS